MVNSTSEQIPRPQSPLRPLRKRKRIVISCTECHRRKQKCDRAFPCANCVSRNKQSACHYENESARKQQLLEESPYTPPDDGPSPGVIKLESDSAAQVSGFGYAKSNGNDNTTTLGIFKKIETHDGDPSSLLSDPALIGTEHSGLREKYKSFIRQLPSKPFVEKLLVTYFREVNYQYYPLDEAIFRLHLTNWYNLSFSTLNKGPLELPGDLQFFPALLFQILSHSLQFQPLDHDPSLDSLKYAASMSFDDLASDYSESGVAIMSLLGKRNTTIVTVQAGFLRTSFLKNCGMGPESWHCLSQTIRDAQEIGLHKNLPDRPRKAEGSAEDSPEDLWMVQLRRRLWMILSLWDIHMALVLGRPTTIDSRDSKPPLPIDAHMPENFRETAPSPRTALDPPTPLTMLLWTAEISTPLLDIFNLEKEDPHQSKYNKVQKMHTMIDQNTIRCPSFFRVHSPDTTFDSHPDCYWLPRARPILQNYAAFTVMALHRPYIFTKSSNRTAALKAGLDILRAQRVFFDLLNATHYKMFSLVLNTFDAIVLVAAIYILYPYENREDLEDTLQHFEWGMERFQAMSGRNSMARSGLGVLKAIHVRLRKALALAEAKCLPHTANSASTSTSPQLLSPEPYSTPNQQQLSRPHQSISGSSTSSTNYSSSTQYTQPTISNLTEPTAASPSTWEVFSDGLSVPANFDFSFMAPLQPMHDLLYNDLSSGDNSNVVDPQLANIGAGIDAGIYGENIVSGVGSWQFGGDFGNDSFWEFMNNYNP